MPQHVLLDHDAAWGALYCWWAVLPFAEARREFVTFVQALSTLHRWPDMMLDALEYGCEPTWLDFEVLDLEMLDIIAEQRARGLDAPPFDARTLQEILMNEFDVVVPARQGRWR